MTLMFSGPHLFVIEKKKNIRKINFFFSMMIIYRAFLCDPAYAHIGSTETKTLIFGNDDEHSFTRVNNGNIRMDVWGITANKQAHQSSKLLFVPCTVLPNPDSDSIKITQDEMQESDIWNMYLSLQTLFDLHNHKAYNIKDDYSFRVHLLYVISLAFGHMYYEKKQANCDDIPDFEKHFTWPVKNFTTLIQDHMSLFKNITRVLTLAVERANQVQMTFFRTTDIVAEAIRKLTMCGLSSMIVLTRNSEHEDFYFSPTVCSDGFQKHAMLECMKSLGNFFKNHESEALGMVTSLFLKGRECIQNYLTFKSILKDRTVCVCCDEICAPIHITIGKCSVCHKCNGILCQSCKSCPCSPSMFSSNKHMNAIMDQFCKSSNKTKELTDKDTHITKLQQQNKAMCETNVKMSKQVEDQKNELSTLQVDMKQLRKDLKRSKNANTKDLDKTSELMASCTRENRKLTDANTVLKKEILQMEVTFKTELDSLKAHCKSLQSHLDAAEKKIESSSEKEKVFNKSHLNRLGDMNRRHNVALKVLTTDFAEKQSRKKQKEGRS
jgi:hypothetical protein